MRNEYIYRYDTVICGVNNDDCEFLHGVGRLMLNSHVDIICIERYN